jgi:hypothetical protein
MPFGNGDILARIGVNAQDGINNLTAVIEELNSFDISQYSRYMRGNMSEA